ncbi:hypothetical protein AVEN_51462-1, partial [Araneus ventricosus]
MALPPDTGPKQGQDAASYAEASDGEGKPSAQMLHEGIPSQ